MNDDKEKTELAKKGDQVAFSKIYEHYWPMVMGVVTRFAGRAEAPDVAQAVFLKLFQNFDEIENPKAVGAWLRTVARHEAISAYRRKAQNNSLDVGAIEEILHLSDESVAARLNSIATTTDVRRILRRLASSRDKTGFRVLTYMLDSISRTGSVPSNREIAGACGLSHAGVAKVLRRLQPQFAEAHAALKDA